MLFPGFFAYKEFLLLEEIRDCRGKLICMANGLTGDIERLTSKERIYISLPVGGKFAFETKETYTVLERVNDELFYVNSFPN